MKRFISALVSVALCLFFAVGAFRWVALPFFPVDVDISIRSVPTDNQLHLVTAWSMLILAILLGCLVLVRLGISLGQHAERTMQASKQSGRLNEKEGGKKT